MGYLLFYLSEQDSQYINNNNNEESEIITVIFQQEHDPTSRYHNCIAKCQVSVSHSYIAYTSFPSDHEYNVKSRMSGTIGQWSRFSYTNSLIKLFLPQMYLNG